MAGGNANDVAAPWPKGGESILLLNLKPFDIIASQTDEVVDSMTLPCAIEVVNAELVADVIAETNAITVNVQDDTGTPKVPVADSAIAAQAAGSAAPQSLTVAPGLTLNAGALLKLSYTSGVADTGTNVMVRLWVKPKF